MQVTTTTYTIAQYCETLEEGKIIVNKDYQRSSEVWPPSARSYLIDTILLGFPMPKISLHQKTDLKSRKTIHEIVDGQQRSTTIQDFFDGKLRLSGHTDFSGKFYRNLTEEEQGRFLNYVLSADLFIAATDEEIRQTFRRINSYTVPLNPEEQRHAHYQGTFKFYIVEITDRFAPALKALGVFTKKQFVRMQDAKLFTELVLAFEGGIKTYSMGNLNECYRSKNDKFPNAKRYTSRFTKAIDAILKWDIIHDGLLMKPSSFYSLVLAVSHAQTPIETLNSAYSRGSRVTIRDDLAVRNLSILLNALECDAPRSKYAAFVRACSEGTNTVNNRSIRFKWISKALDPQPLK